MKIFNVLRISREPGEDSLPLIIDSDEGGLSSADISPFDPLDIFGHPILESRAQADDPFPAFKYQVPLKKAVQTINIGHVVFFELGHEMSEDRCFRDVCIRDSAIKRIMAKFIRGQNVDDE